MATLTNSWDNARSWWQNAAPATRAAATAIALLLVVGLIFAVSMASSPNYVSIYTGVSGEDASSIQTLLQGHGIEMQYSSADQSVSVPAKDQSNAIMYIEAAGILSKDAKIVGLSSLDDTNITSSPDIINVKINAAREGELERMLMQLDPIQDANVKLSGGNDTSLFEDDTPPSASAVLTLRSGDTLTPDQAKGIASLLARAVPGLDAKNVTLTDQTGTPLWPESDTGGGNNQTSADSRFAERERVKLQQLLDSTIGPGKSVVTVNAELDFDQITKQIIQHVPTTPGGSSSLPLSESDKEESYTGSGAPGGVGGPAGMASNVNAPSYTSSSSSGSGGNYKSSDTLTNYVDNVDTTNIIAAPGSVKNLMVGVLIDSSVPPSTAAAVQKEISTLVGVAPSDPTRQVLVQEIPFDTSAQKLATAAMKSAQSQQLISEIIKAVVALAVVGILFFLATRGTKVHTSQMALAAEGAHIGLLERNGVDIEEAILEERPLRIEDVLAEMPEVMPNRPRRRSQAPAIEEQQDLKLEGVQEMIAGSPQSVALLLKGWMADDSKIAS